MNKTTVEVLILLLIVAIIVPLFFLVRSGDQEKIKEWAEGEGYEIKSSESTWIDRGPFWVKNKNDRIYRVVVETESGERVMYFRFRLWWVDKEWEK